MLKAAVMVGRETGNAIRVHTDLYTENGIDEKTYLSLLTVNVKNFLKQTKVILFTLPT